MSTITIRSSVAVPASSPPPLLKPGVSPGLATIIASLCSFMVVMDGAIVNVALPAMAADLDLGLAARQWVVEAYLVALGGFMLCAARLSDIHGRRLVLQAGLIVFSLASLAGGAAGSGAVLIAARAVQGLGAGVLATSTLAVLVAAHPPGAGRERAIGIWTASAAVAAAFGVLAGGLLTAEVSWRWVMYVNVPVGAALILITRTALLARSARAVQAAPDLAGALTVTAAMAALVAGLAETVSRGWTALPVLGLLGSAAVLGVAFVVIEMRASEPLMRPGLLKLRNVAVGNLMLACLGATLTACMFFLPDFLHRMAGYDARRTGLAMLPMCVAIAAGSLGARWLRRLVPVRLPLLGSVVAAAGLAWLTTMPAAVVFSRDLLGPGLLVGAGLGVVVATAVQAAIGGLPPRDTALASGLLNTSRQLGGALGIAIFVTLADAAGGGDPLVSCHAAFAAIAVAALLTGLSSLLLHGHRP